MQHPKPRVEFSEEFKAFAGQLIDQCNKSDNPKLRITRRALNVLASDHGFRILTTPNQRALRELMGERGYKIQIGAEAVFLSRIPVTNVSQDQWPALIDNICQKLIQMYGETGEETLRLSPAKFRNVATIWPADNPAFNQQCVEAMAARKYTLVFRVNYIDLCADYIKPVHGKKPAPAVVLEPLVEVMNGRQLLPIALHPRREVWRRGFTHALLINAKHKGSWGDTALSHGLLHFRDAVVDKNGAVLTQLALNHGDVLLVNDLAYAEVKKCKISCIDSGSVYEPAIMAVPLHKDSVNV
jgi:hypothetical protein